MKIFSRFFQDLRPQKTITNNVDLFKDKVELGETAFNLTPDDNSPKPNRNDFTFEDDYTNALLDWQAVQMEKLAKKYPEAAVRGELFYGCNLPPDYVFENGIPEKGGQSFDLGKHQRQIDDEGKTDRKFSAMRGGCLIASVPAGMTGEGGWVYKLVPVGVGIDLSRALLGNNVLSNPNEVNIMPGELEISFASRQPLSAIIGCYPVKDFSHTFNSFRLGTFIENPNFKK